MIEVACQCEGLPAHDHYMGQALQDYDGCQAWGPRYDLDDVGRVWVPWKVVAHALSDVLGAAPQGVDGPSAP